MTDDESDANNPAGDSEDDQSFAARLLEQLRQDAGDEAEGKPVGRHYFSGKQMDRDAAAEPGQNQDEAP